MYATKLFANIDALKESGETLPKALFLSPIPSDVIELHEKRLGIQLQPDERPLLAVNKKIVGTVGGYGWTGITIAILAGNNPWFVPFASFFMAYLTKGCELMATYANVPSQLIDIIQGVIFLFFAAEQFLSKYRQKLVVKTAQEELAAKAALEAQKGGAERA